MRSILKIESIEFGDDWMRDIQYGKVRSKRGCPNFWFEQLFG